MTDNSNHFFDNVALLYDFAIEPLPNKFIELICKRFNITEKSRIIDLGCGSGLLAIALSQFSANVEGVDLSKEMLRIAQSRDSTHHVRWILSSVEDFDCGANRNDLVISFEAFHLFNDAQSLIQRCATSLRRGGYFCVGWIKYHWETKLYHIFVDEFRSYGIEWGTNPNLAIFDLNPFTSKEHHLTPFTHESIDVKAKTPVKKIASFLISTHKAESLSLEARNYLRQRLDTRIKTELLSEYSEGIDVYDIFYSQRI